MRVSSENGGSDPARKQWAARMAFTAGTWIKEARIRHSQSPVWVKRRAGTAPRIRSCWAEVGKWERMNHFFFPSGRGGKVRGREGGRRNRAVE